MLIFNIILHIIMQTSFTLSPLTRDHGERQSWLYDVKFAGGGSQVFILPCDAIRITLNCDDLFRGLTTMLQRHPFLEKAFRCFAEAKEKIKKLLELRRVTDQYWPEWEAFFESLPQSEEDPRYPLAITTSALLSLMNHFMGAVQVTCYY